MSGSPDQVPVPPKPPIKILFIDDDRSEYELIMPMLSDSKIFHYDVEYVGSYQEGHSKLLRNEHSVCLLDYNLGMETGLELMRSARRDGSRVPIILLTGAVDENIDYKVMQEGAEDYIRKGEATPETLERALRYTVLRHKIQDELIAAHDEKNEFISFITHDLRAPLNHISSVVANAQQDGEYEGHMSDIAHVSDYLLEQINDLLDLNRLDDLVHRKIHETVFEIPHVIDKAVFFIKSYAERQKVKIKSSIEGQLPDLKADVRMVRQILINLIYNALKHGGDVSLVTIRAYLDGMHVVLEVRDDGVGMPEVEIQHLFNADHAERQVAQGEGLGLPLSKRYIELHGGSLEIRSKPDEYTEIRVIFPSDRVLRDKNSIEEAAEAQSQKETQEEKEKRTA